MKGSKFSYRVRVALLIETASRYGRGLLRGIVQWNQEQKQPWLLYLGEYRKGNIIPEELEAGQCDAVIARIETPALAKYLQTLRCPVVDVSYFRLLPGVPSVDQDHDAFGKMAFAHLYEIGLRHLAFLGDLQMPWARCRGDSFVQAAEEAGLECHVYGSQTVRAAPSFLSADLMKWASSLPKPVGVFCAWDGLARQLLQACQSGGIHVPDEVAVLGVGNDELEISLCTPPVSSIPNNSEGAGYRAAEMLNAMLGNPQLLPADILLSPLELVTRQSTDVLALADVRIRAAIRMIRERACLGLKVDDILRAVPLSRRELELRFQKYVGRSPHQEILRNRLDRAKRLLRETELGLAEVADRCGFEHPEYFSVVFKREEQLTPHAWRKLERENQKGATGRNWK
ncbi:MAG: DNA-binding transcriptional regulator [Verrucomicrobiota bacterium]